MSQELSESSGVVGVLPMNFPKKSVMTNFVSRLMLAALLFLQLSFLPTSVFAQNNDPKPAEQKPPATGERREAVPRRIDEIAEIGRDMTGPASNPECYWLGKRVVSLLWRDDLDTAFRHLDLYDRFGCPGGQIQATFRCVVRLPEIDTKSTDALKAADALNARIHTCWKNPSQQPPATPATTAATPSDNGTTNR